MTRDDLERGAEPDSSYYIQNEFLVRNKENIDLNTDPPPDLVLEVEYSRSNIDKLALYASMRVPEFWRYNGNMLRVYTLNSGQYSQSDRSPTFAPVLLTEIPRFIQESKKVGQIAATRAFRTWVRQQISTAGQKFIKKNVSTAKNCDRTLPIPTRANFTYQRTATLFGACVALA